MDARKLNDAIGEVDEKYLAEAMTETKAKKPKAARRTLPRWLPIAACALLAVGIGWVALNAAGNTRGSSASTDDAAPDMSSTTSDSGTDTTTDIATDDVINVNEGEPTATGDSSNAWAAELVYTETWLPEDFYAYMGFEPQLYRPDGLYESIANAISEVTVVRSNEDGRLLDGTLTLMCYTGFYDDGSPVLTEDVAATKGYTLEATPAGAEGDAIDYVLEDGSEVSTIADCDVRIWHVNAEAGPYDEETHEAATTYDWYYAEFTYRDVSFKLSCSQLDLETVVEVIRTIVTDESTYLEDTSVHSSAYGPEDVIAYFGSDLVPAYLPEGLVPDPNNGTGTANLYSNDEIASMEVSLSFWTKIYDDGSNEAPGVSLSATKTGWLYNHEDPQGEKKVFNGTSAWITDSNNIYARGSGARHHYIADFTYNDIDYSIAVFELDQSELEKIVQSIVG